MSVKGDKPQNNHASPQVIAGSADPKHSLPKAHCKPPQKSDDKQEHKNIIFLFAADIGVHKQNQPHKHGAVHHIKHLLIHSQRQAHIKLTNHPPTV